MHGPPLFHEIVDAISEEFNLPKGKGVGCGKRHPTPQIIRPYLYIPMDNTLIFCSYEFLPSKKNQAAVLQLSNLNSHTEIGAMRVYTNTVISTHNTFYCTVVSKMSVRICGRFVFPPYVQMKSVDQHTFTTLHNKRILIQSFQCGCTKHLGLNSCDSFYFNTETLNNCYE